MKYIEVVSLNRFLTENFQNKKVPFSLYVTKILKETASFIQEYDEKRIAIIGKFATVDENGNFLGKVKEDGTRVENPQLLSDLEIEDMKGLETAINELSMQEVEYSVEPLDLEKSYFNTEIKEKQTVGDFIDTNIEPNLIAQMSMFGIIKL